MALVFLVIYSLYLSLAGASNEFFCRQGSLICYRLSERTGEHEYYSCDASVPRSNVIGRCKKDLLCYADFREPCIPFDELNGEMDNSLDNGRSWELIREQNKIGSTERHLWSNKVIPARATPLNYFDLLGKTMQSRNKRLPIIEQGLLPTALREDVGAFNENEVRPLQGVKTGKFWLKWSLD